MKTIKMNINRHNQRGAVLVVSLIMLLLITAVAVSTLSSSTFQTAMATNAQQREAILRVAESAAEQPLNNSVLPLAYNAFLKWDGTKVENDRTYVVPAAQLSTTQPGVTMSGQVLFMGMSPADGYQVNMYRYWIYESRGSAQSSDQSAYADAKVATQVVQGAAKITPMPGCGTYEPC